MKSALICFLASIVAGCQAPPLQRFTVRDVTAVQALFDSLAADARAGDWEGVGDRFAYDARFVAGNTIVLGRTAITHWGKALPPLETFSFGPADVHGDAGLAYALGALYVKFRDLPSDSAKQLVVLRREPDRRWLIQAINITMDLPAALPAQLSQTAPR